MKTKLTFLLILLALSFAGPAAAAQVSFKNIVIDRTFRAEGVAAGDINHDVKLDIFSGDV